MAAMPEILGLNLAEMAVCYKKIVMPEAPVRDVTYWKHNHLQQKDNTYMLYSNHGNNNLWKEVVLYCWDRGAF